jgi:hypothetical protein
MKYHLANELPRPVSFDLAVVPPETADDVYRRFMAYGAPLIAVASKLGITGCRVVSDTHRLNFKWSFL